MFQCFGFLRKRQETRRDVPVFPVVGNDRDRLFVIFGQHAAERRTVVRLEAHPIADLEFQHLIVRPRLTQETQPFDDPAVKINQFILGKQSPGGDVVSNCAFRSNSMNDFKSWER